MSYGQKLALKVVSQYFNHPFLGLIPSSFPFHPYIWLIQFFSQSYTYYLSSTFCYASIFTFRNSHSVNTLCNSIVSQKILIMKMWQFRLWSSKALKSLRQHFYAYNISSRLFQSSSTIIFITSSWLSASYLIYVILSVPTCTRITDFVGFSWKITHGRTVIDMENCRNLWPGADYSELTLWYAIE
jgi:hypothetical protein